MEHGALWLIDRETARLAPPEHDLWTLHDRPLEVLPRYEAALGRAITLHLDTLSFSLLRRALEDLAVDMRAVVGDNTRDEEDAANLDVLERFVLPAMWQVDEDVAHLERHMGELGSTAAVQVS